MNVLFYKQGYKYQVVADLVTQTPVRQAALCTTERLELRPDGQLTIYAGYASDGPSGPTIDTPAFMRGAFIHDAFYELIRRRLLAPEWRATADDFLRVCCREDGMGPVRAWWVWRAVRSFGASAAAVENAKPVLRAPR